MGLSKIKRSLQKNQLGKCVIKIYHYIIGVPLFKFNTLRYRFLKDKIGTMSFYSIDETFDFLRSGYSISRFGDGEIAWIYCDSKEAFGQENSKELSNYLRNVLLSNSNKLLIGIPGYLGKRDHYTSRFIEASEAHLAKYGKRWMKLLDNERLYADSLLTRPYFGFDKETYTFLFESWKTIWNDKDILIIEGKDTKFGVGNDLLDNANSIERLVCPSENAFSIYNTILKKSLYHSKDRLVLVALGPTATILTYDLCQNGIQAIDIGHLDIEYEWYIHGAANKIPVKGKYVNESGGKPEDYIDKIDYDIYIKQVIDRCE